MGVPVFPGVLVMLGEFRAVMLWVKGVWGNGLRGSGVRGVLLEELIGLTVCVWGVVWVCVEGEVEEVVWRGEFGLCWYRWGLGVGWGMGGIPWTSSSSIKSPGWGWGGSGPRLRLVA